MDTIISEKVISNDGTPIAYHRSGTGPPLVLVPGAGGAGPSAWTVFPRLQEHFTVYAVDRRGHGESGDGPAYALEREFEDIAAVVDSIEGPVNLLGHSFGGMVILEAALRTTNLRRLIVYEGAPIPEIVNAFAKEAEQLQVLLDAGDLEGVLVKHYCEFMKLQDIEQFKNSPAWSERLDSARTLPRELRGVAQYQFDSQRFRDLHTPTLLMLGGNSPAFETKAAETLNAILPNSRIAVLPGQEHIAIYTAPELFLQELLAFVPRRF